MLRFEDARDQLQQCRLAAAAGTLDQDPFTGLDDQVQTAEEFRQMGRVTEMKISNLDPPWPLRVNSEIAHFRGFGLQQVLDPSGTALQGFEKADAGHQRQPQIHQRKCRQGHGDHQRGRELAVGMGRKSQLQNYPEREIADQRQAELRQRLQPALTALCGQHHPTCAKHLAAEFGGPIKAEQLCPAGAPVGGERPHFDTCDR